MVSYVFFNTCAACWLAKTDCQQSGSQSVRGRQKKGFRKAMGGNESGIEIGVITKQWEEKRGAKEPVTEQMQKSQCLSAPWTASSAPGWP